MDDRTQKSPLTTPLAPHRRTEGLELIPLGTGSPLCYFAFGQGHLPKSEHLEWSVEVYFLGPSGPPRKFALLKTRSEPGGRVWELNMNPPDYDGRVSECMYREHGLGLRDIKLQLEEEATKRFPPTGGRTPPPEKRSNVPS